MASFSVEDFVGNGALKELLPKLLDDGWDDVPTLKLMKYEDMDAIAMSRHQKDVLELRSYLHDRSLMHYADRLESSGKPLPNLLTLTTADLSTQFSMKRGHIARFIDRTTPCSDEPNPKSYALSTRKFTQIPSRTSRTFKSSSDSAASSRRPSFTKSPGRVGYTEKSLDQSLAELKIRDGYVFKGIVAAGPAEPRACGCVKPPPVVDAVAPYSAIENVLLQKLTPEYKIGMERLVKAKTAAVKAAELWREKPAVLVCVRRPGCVMCRAEAHQLYSRKPIFDALGIQLIAILHENLESEVKDFWPRYWGGIVMLDRRMEFFKALGGGKLQKESFISGFLLNPRAIANYKRARAVGSVDQNFRGDGEIKGGLFVVGSGKSGIAYQFIERNFGDWAPLAEVIEICSQLRNQSQQQNQAGISRASDECHS